VEAVVGLECNEVRLDEILSPRALIRLAEPSRPLPVDAAAAAH
jgi:hypothetical protein